MTVDPRDILALHLALAIARIEALEARVRVLEERQPARPAFYLPPPAALEIDTPEMAAAKAAIANEPLAPRKAYARQPRLADRDPEHARRWETLRLA